MNVQCKSQPKSDISDLVARSEREAKRERLLAICSAAVLEVSLSRVSPPWICHGFEESGHSLAVRSTCARRNALNSIHKHTVKPATAVFIEI